MLDGSGEALLKDILHHGMITDSPSNKLPERRLVRKKSLNDSTLSVLFHHRSQFFTDLHRSFFRICFENAPDDGDDVLGNHIGTIHFDIPVQ